MVFSTERSSSSGGQEQTETPEQLEKEALEHFRAIPPERQRQTLECLKAIADLHRRLN